MITVFDLTQEQVQRLRNTPIGKKQMDYHDKNDEIVSTGEIVRYPNGEVFMPILTDGIEDIWGPEQAAQIVSKFAADMAVFREHYPPGPPKHEDKRFKESYEGDLARCTLLGYKVGVHLIGMRWYCLNPLMRNGYILFGLGLDAVLRFRQKILWRIERSSRLHCTHQRGTISGRFRRWEYKLW